MLLKILNGGDDLMHEQVTILLKLILSDGVVRWYDDLEQDIRLLQFLRPFFPVEGSSLTLNCLVSLTYEDDGYSDLDIQLIEGTFSLMVDKDRWEASGKSFDHLTGEIKENTEQVLDEFSEASPILKIRHSLNTELFNFIGTSIAGTMSREDKPQWQKDLVQSVLLYQAALDLQGEPFLDRYNIKTINVPDPSSTVRAFGEPRQVTFTEYYHIKLPGVFNNQLFQIFETVLRDLAAFSLPGDSTTYGDEDL